MWYCANVDAKAIRAYARRDWTLIERRKREYWAKRYREQGAAPLRRVADALREHLLAVRPDWPSEADREADLAHHVALKRLLDAAGDAFRRR